MGLAGLQSFLSIAFLFVCWIGAACVVCIFEGLSYIIVRPFSLSRHRRICLLFSNAFWLSSTFLLETWSGITFKSYGHIISPNRSHLAVINHLSDVDWLLGLAYVAKFRYPYPGNSKSVVKASLGNVPIFGYILHLAEFLFLTRSWATDRDRFLHTLKSLRGFSDTVSPLWFVLYPEGTRLTTEKLRYSQAYAAAKHLKSPNHVLFPRFKAFTAILSTLRQEFGGIVDATFMFEGEHPSIRSTLSGTASTVVHVHTNYFPMDQVPEGNEQLEKWLLDRWYDKDRRIADFKRDITTLGPPHKKYFPFPGKPSLLPLFALVATFFLCFVTIIYVSSRIQNGVKALVIISLSTVALTGSLVVFNIMPSRKGSKCKRQSVSNSKLQFSTKSTS